MDGEQTLAVIKDGNLSHINFVGNGIFGRWEPGGTRRYYITDHLGSTRAVVDDAGTVLETFDYYPFGLLMPKRNTAGANTLEKFTGKERDEEGGLNLDYFGARYYDAALGRWHSVDPIVKHHESLYASFANNPLRFIDPLGTDTVEVRHESGELVNHIEAEGEDVFHIVDQDGNRLEDQFIKFDEGTLMGVNQPKANTKEGEVNMTLYRMKGDENSKELFEFFSNPKNTNVEWTHAKIGTESSGSNVVGTNNSESSTAVGHYLRVTNYTLREVVHNHPSGIAFPSGGDMRGARLYHGNNPNTILKVYAHPKKYRVYNEYGVVMDEIIVNPDN